MHKLEQQVSGRESSTRPVGSFLTALFARMEESGVSYCVLRNYEGLPDCVGNDVDMFVTSGEERGFEDSLQDASRASDWLLVRTVKRFGFASYWFVHGPTRSALHIDAWSRLTWRGLPLVDAAEISRHRRRFGTFFVAEEATEAAILLLKDLVQNGRIREKYFPRIQAVAVAHADRLQTLLARTLGRNLAIQLTKAAAGGDWKELNSRCGRIRRSLLRHGFCPNPLVAIRGCLGFLVGHLQPLFARSNGMSVALIGPDGSGKSTVVQELKRALQGLFPATRSFHGRFRVVPDMRFWLNIVRRIAGRKPLLAAPAGPEAIHEAPPHGRLRTFVHVAYYSLDFFLGHLIHWRARSHGQLILFDRYYYDWFILASLGRLPRWLLPVMEFVYPRPDLVIYLHNAPDVIHRRKPELSVGEIAAQGDRCQWIIETVSHGVVVSTAADLDAVVDAVAEAVVRQATSRFRLTQQTVERLSNNQASVCRRTLGMPGVSPSPRLDGRTSSMQGMDK